MNIIAKNMILNLTQSTIQQKYVQNKYRIKSIKKT